MAQNKVSVEFQLKAATGEFGKAMRSANGDVSKTTQSVSKFIDAFTDLGMKGSKGAKAVTKELQTLLDMLNKLDKTKLAALSPAERINISGQQLAVQSAMKQALPSTIASAEAKQQKQQQALEAKALKEQEQAIRKYNSTLITMRYSLYDVANAGQMAGQALTEFATASITAAAAQEAAFSQIQKTQVGTETTTEQMDKLKSALLQMSATMPVSFADLSKIGMLAAQLGIEADSIAKFTEVVAQFSAVSGMSAEEAAMGFGKLANLLGLADDQYQSLGAAIAKTGVTSAATEQQIINTAGQIAAIGKAAGLTSSEIIGLSSSMASLKIAPEEARGVLVQAFHAMDRAVASYSTGLQKGNESLNKFAEISGMSAKEFVDNWSDKKNGGAGQAWNSFINGMSKQSDISKALRQLGLDGIRTSKGLTALALGAADYNKQLAIAKEAGTSGTFLDDAYATIADDLTASLKELKNAADNAMAAMSNNPAVMGTLKFIVDTVTVLLNGFRTLSEMPGIGILVNTISALAIALAGIAGLALTLAAGIGIAAGSFLAMKTATQTVSAELNGASWSLANLLKIMMSTPVAAGTAAASITGVTTATTGLVAAEGTAIVATNGLKLALISTGIGAIVVLVGSLIAGLMSMTTATDEVVTGLDEQQKASRDALRELSSLNSEISEFVDMALAASLSSIDMQDSLYSLGSSVKENGNDFSEMSDSGRKNLKALASTIKAITSAAGTDNQTMANNLAALKKSLEDAGITGKAAFDLISTAMQTTGVTGNASGILLQSFLDGLVKASTKASVSVKTTLDYASDLMGVIKNAASIRFGKENGLVAMGDAVAKMKQDASDATARVKELQATLAQKRGTRQQLQTRLNLASQYGATGLAEKTQAELDTLNSEVSAAETEMQYNIDKMSGSLNLNTQAGRDNFKAIQDLADGYMDYINGIAQSGKSQTEVNKAVKDSKKGFEDQLIAMGFSKKKVEELSKQFDGFGTLIKDTFNDITVNVKTGPAQQAIDAFLDNNSNKSITIGVGLGDKPDATKPDSSTSKPEVDKTTNGKGKVVNNPSRVPTVKYQTLDEAYKAKAAREAKAAKEAKAARDKLSKKSSNSIFGLLNQSSPASPFGGLGSNGSYNPSKYLTQSNANGGALVVSLSPEDRALLNAAVARPITLKTDDKIIAKSANNGNMLLLRKANG